MTNANPATLEVARHPLRLSVVIPVHNGGEAFKQCLHSLEKFAPDGVEIVVVADGDKISADIARYVADRVIVTEKPAGPARARNLGAQAASGDIILFVDADTTINRQTIPQTVDAFTQNPELSALIGSYDDEPGAMNFLSQYKNLFHHYNHQNGSEEASTFWGACGAIRREIFLKVGGFDEGYRRPCVEDIELGHRLKQAGYNIRLYKDIHVKHLKKWEPISLLKAEFFYRALPWTALILRDREFNNDLNLQWSSRISVVLAYGLLAALVATRWQSEIFLLTVLLALALFSINAPVYQFFYSKRGLAFALKTIPWHWLYYIYSGLAFAIGVVRHLVNTTFSEPARKEANG